MGWWGLGGARLELRTTPGDAQDQSHPDAVCRNQTGMQPKTSALSKGNDWEQAAGDGDGLGTRRDIFIQGSESCGFTKFHANIEALGASESRAGGFREVMNSSIES